MTVVDTDVFVWYLRGNARAAAAIEAASGVSVSVITYLELVQGARSKREAGWLRATLAGLAGAEGAAVLARRSSGRRKVLGVPVGRRNGFKLPGRGGGFKRDARKVTGAVSDAAKRADSVGQKVSQVASTIQKVSETADNATKKA